MLKGTDRRMSGSSQDVYEQLPNYDNTVLLQNTTEDMHQPRRNNSSTDLRPLIEVESGSQSMHKPSVLATLSLRRETVLHGKVRQAGYRAVHIIIRILPALVIYGGTLALLVCVFFKHRWGVILSLLLYAFYMCINSWEIAVFGAWGILMCWIHGHNDWYAMYCKDRDREMATPKHQQEFIRKGVLPNDNPNEGQPSLHHTHKYPSSDSWTLGSSCDLQWDDIFHVVMIPTYKTPYEVLVASIQCVGQFSQAKTNIGVCLAFEEREPDSRKKAKSLQKEFEDQFYFVTAAFHPPDLPRHVPGKSSNECWAFSELVKELQDIHGIKSDDPRVLVTVIDDDSELHENYFEALTCKFLQTNDTQKYLTLWQPPIVHFKNYLEQPSFVRIASIFTSLHELACLANPLDCHVPFSSYSLSLILASAVGGWDPDFISEDWHMMAKCKLMTEGRAKCQPIFLPLMNYAPEEDTYLATLKSRWVQATRHALGVGEIVYVVSSVYVGIFETGSVSRAVLFLWRMMPLICKFIAVHFVVATLAIWPFLSHLLIHWFMWKSWCYIEDLGQTCATCCVPVKAFDVGIGEERVILDSWMVYLQQKANFGYFIGMLMVGGLGTFYFNFVKDRVAGDVNSNCIVSNPLLLWLRTNLDLLALGWLSSLAFASIPEWIAVIRIIVTLKFNHVVAGMVGRADNDGTL